MERNYEFRQRMLQRHRYDLRQADRSGNQVEIDESYIIAIDKNAGRVIENAALDLQEFLRRSMDVALAVKRYADLEAIDRNCIIIKVCGCVEPVSGACKVMAAEGCITLAGYDERGAAQACFRAQDQMTLNMGPYLEGEKVYVPKFSPRMSHSGYGLDDFPDAHLLSIAHAGMDSILVFVKDVNLSPKGYLDFNTLIWRAAGFGLDVYAYSYYHSERNPEDPDAFEHYNGTYGKLFQSCPGLKGVVFVGESCAFPSKDPRVSGILQQSMIDGIPSEKPRSGWFPCADYPQWLNYVKGIITRYKPDADIVFWTYNWGNAPEEDRLALIDNLPTDISLMVTFEMYDNYDVGDVPAATTDYTICVPGPGPYFVSEAKKAKERGIRLYTQANASGLAWDFGTIPYAPFPAHWHARYDALLKAREDYGLSGIMENHHYGFYPSFISAMETMRYEEDLTAQEAMERQAILLYGKENAQLGLDAWKCLDKAMDCYMSTNEDQYGPARIGPAYPFMYQNVPQIPKEPTAHHGGNIITFPDYGSDMLFFHTHHTMGSSGMPQFRFEKELKSLEKMRWYLGRALLTFALLEPRLSGWRLEECSRLSNLVKYIDCCVLTIINSKKWHHHRWTVKAHPDPKSVLALLKQMIAIGYEEIQNAEDAIPLLEADSRLGWEPSMEYNGSKRNVEWKIRQTRQVIEHEIPAIIAHVEKYLNR